jgi:hypothetical protein
MPPGNPGFCEKDDGEKTAELGLIARRMKIFYYIKRFNNFTKSEKIIFLVSFAISGIVRLFTLYLPVKFYFFIFKLKPSFISRNNETNSDYWMVLNMINKVSNHVPWESNCLVKTLTSKIILSFLGIDTIVILRVSKSNSERISAHALIKQSCYQKKLIETRYTEFILSY